MRSAPASGSPSPSAGKSTLAIARAYRPSLQLIIEEGDDASEEERTNDISTLASSTPTVTLVNSLLATALEEGASDLHFEPRREDMLVRIRVDGVMRELATVPRQMQQAVTSRLKMMGKLDIADRRAPKDGRLAAFFDTGRIDMRIAVVATTHGEQVVLRILGSGGDQHPSIAGLEMEPYAEAAFVTAIEQPYGTVIVCGPTGSGKTTTLYGAIDHLNRSDRVVMTIEDPVEWRLDGVNQIEVDVKGGLTFASGLRTILRSDPDVLLVGEVRDYETASIAIQAAMKGHLVLTSLYAHNAASAIARLRDMGVDASMLAGSLNAVVAQRLARRLCVHCRREYAANAEELGVADQTMSDDVLLYAAVGCAKCQGTGYIGRVALREVMPVHGEVRALVESSAEEIFAAAVRQGMTTLRDDGMRLALTGVSSVDEIRRVTGIRLI